MGVVAERLFAAACALVCAACLIGTIAAVAMGQRPAFSGSHRLTWVDGCAMLAIVTGAAALVIAFCSLDATSPPKIAHLGEKI